MYVHIKLKGVRGSIIEGYSMYRKQCASKVCPYITQQSPTFLFLSRGLSKTLFYSLGNTASALPRKMNISLSLSLSLALSISLTGLVFRASPMSFTRTFCLSLSYPEINFLRRIALADLSESSS